MPQSLASIYVHCVFSTKGRLDTITDPPDLHRQIGGISKRIDCQPLIVGGTKNHVHVLAVLGRTITVADWVKEIKRVSSVGRPDLAWQSGYGAFSVGKEQVEVVCTYIANQEEHHRKVDFEAEYRRLLAEQGIEWDERFVWD